MASWGWVAQGASVSQRLKKEKHNKEGRTKKQRLEEKRVRKVIQEIVSIFFSESE